MFNFLDDYIFQVKKFVSLDYFQKRDYGVSDLLLWGRFVDRSVVLNIDGSLLTSFNFRGDDLDSSTDDDLAYMSQYVNMAMCKLGNGWSIHLDCIRKRSVSYIDESDCHFNNATDLLIDRERRFNYNQEDSHFENEYILNFTWLPPSDGFERVAMVFNKQDEKKSKSSVDYSKHLITFKENIDNVISILKTKFRLRLLDDHEILSYLQYCVTGYYLKLKNPDFQYTDIRYVCANQDLIAGNNPKIGDKFFKVISLGENFPNNSYPTILKSLSTLGFEYRWNTRFVFLDKPDAIKLLTRISKEHSQGRKAALSMIAEQTGIGGQAKINNDADRLFNEAENAIDLSKIGGVRFGIYTSSIIIYDADEESLAQKVKIVKSTINNLNFLARVEDMNCVEAYLGAMPSNVRQNLRQYPIHTMNLADLLPTTAVWAGFNENQCRYYKEAKNNPPLFYSSTTGNTPFRVSLHVGDIGHTLVVGSSRGGKSTLLNFIAAQHMRYKNAKVYLFDDKYSALPHCFAVNAAHYDIGADDIDISFKPLEHIDSDSDYSTALEWLYLICELNDFKLKSEHRTVISDVLNSMRESSSNEQKTLSYFYYLLIGRDPIIAENFKPYTKEGSGLQSKIFDNKNDGLAFDNFNVFEMSKIMRTGSSVVLPTLLYIFNMIEKFADGSPTLIIIDEASIALKSEAFSSILEDKIRRAAKLNISIILASQQISDITKSKLFDVLLDNCKTKFILPNQEASKDYNKALYASFGLNEKQISLIANALPQREYYYMSPLGNRIFTLNLQNCQTALPFLTKTGVEDINLAKEFKNKYDGLFGYHWLKHHDEPKLANAWLDIHNNLESKK